MVYEKYGIDPVEAKLRGMLLIEYLKIEEPELARNFGEIPSDLSDKIDCFEIVWPLPILEKYAETRRLNDMIALREIIQNALDVEHEMFGYDSIDIKIYEDALGTHVVDRGKGLPWNAFMIGRTEKPSYVRGHFGEGLDLATLYLASRGFPTYIFTKNIVYKTAYYKPKDIFSVVIGKTKDYTQGTHVLLYKVRLKKEVLKKIYWKLNDELKVIGYVKYARDKKMPEMPNLIFEDKNSRKKLYVRDIFVNYADEIAGKPFFYSYNLWWVELDPNRTNVYSMSELSDAMKTVLVLQPHCLLNLIKNFIAKKEYGGIMYYSLDGVKKFYEGELNFGYFKEDMANKIQFRELIAGLKQLTSDYHIDTYASLSDVDAIPLVNHEGGVILLVPSEYMSLFSTVIPHATDFMIKSTEKMLKDVIVLRDEELSLDTLIKFGKFRLIANELSEVLSLKRPIKVVPIKGRSHSVDVIAYVDIEAWERTFIHELAHCVATVLYKSAQDVTEDFERALEFVGETIVKMLEQQHYTKTFIRINNGGVYAVARFGEVIPIEYGEYKVLRRDFDVYENYKNPDLILIGAVSKIGDKTGLTVYPTNFTIGIATFYNYIENPYLIGYYRFIDVIADIVERLLKAHIGIAEPVRSDEFGAYSELINSISGYIRRIPPDSEKYLLFYYDVKTDKYLLKKEIIGVRT